MKNPAEEATRRSILRTVGAGVVATSVVAGSASAQDGEVTQRFEFEGITSGWMGVAPSDIRGVENPTLNLEAGATYEFYWENGDGAPHNVIIEDASGNTLEQTELISSGTQTLQFTATEDMDTYYCEVHPSQMRGAVEVSGSSSAGTATATPTGGETHEVLMVTSDDGEYYFDPIGLHVQPGDTIQWTIESGSHNTVSYDERIPESAETWNTEIISDGSHELVAETEGTYDYYCMPHQTLGMIGRFVVGEPSGPAEGSTPDHGDVPESSAIVEAGSISYEEFTSGDTTETATPEPTEAGTGEAMTSAAPEEQDSTTEASGPGFTVGGALSAIGAGALLRAYRNREE